MILKWRTAGQACTHANRIYVQSGVHEQFEKMILDAVSKISVGHGSQPGSTTGPLTTPRGIEKLEMLVEDARSKGGKVKTGGRRPPTLTKGKLLRTHGHLRNDVRYVGFKRGDFWSLALYLQV
jgi:succinate-semialdehyde dehydrogenase/glutarate-semialdehyde dehydrogenase